MRGLSGDGVWVSGGSMAVRVDAANHTAAPRFQLQCSPWELSYDFRQLTLTAGDYGVWLSCQTPGDGKREPVTLPGHLRRLDPLTGAPVGEIGEIELPRPAREISGDAHLAWALEDVDTKTGKNRCRLYAIDLDVSRLRRTIELGAFSCRQLHATADDAWLLRTVKSHEEIIKVDLAAGRIAVVIPVPGGRLPLGLTIADDVVWVATSLEWPSRDTSLGSAGGLMRIDRTTGRAGPSLIPTGSADRIIGARGTDVWLYEREGAIVKVHDER